MNKTFATLALSTTALLAACGGSSGTTGTGGHSTGGHSTSSGVETGGSGPGAAMACADLAKARCDQLAMCSNGSLVTTRYGDAATCEARQQVTCLASLAAAHTGNTPVHTEGCSAALPMEACSDALDNSPPAACATQAGTLAAGAACAFSAQCASAYCHTPSGAPCGTCAALPKAGDACAVTADCGPGLLCSKFSSTCAAPVAANGACGMGAQCAAGLSCVGGSMMAMGACKPAVTATGMACDPSRKTGPDCDRNLGLACDATSMKCAAITFAAGGAACGVVNGARVECEKGGLCSSTGMGMGTCLAAAADGAACDASAGPPCLLPARCVATADGGTAGTCQLPSATACH